jgi:hypothetical protein
MIDTINQAADLIAQFDRSAANVFRNRPFHRVTLATAFRAGFLKHSEHTLKVCDIVDRVAALDVRMRAA